MPDRDSAVYALEDQNKEWFEEISHTIFTHPELGDEEYFSSEYLAGEMEKAGFRVTRPYLDLPTAFRCEYGDDDGPVIAFLAEYDALPGYLENGTKPGHACGHNWIAASSFAAACTLKEYKDKYGFHGKIVYLGTPAEETTSRKITLIERGAFRDIDVAFEMHLSRYLELRPKALAMTILWYDFYGQASHASGAPEKGINALDAANLTFAGVNCLRQHVKSDVRIHGVIRDGGKAPNVVPDHSQIEMYVRSADKDYLEEVIEKVNNCARGAALMTGAKLKITRDAYTTYDIKTRSGLVRLIRAELEKLGIREDPDEEIPRSAGSTDVGNVSYEVPMCYVHLGTGAVSTAGTHDAEYLSVVDSAYAHELLHKGAKAMAASALELFAHPEQIKELG